jgi:ketosteroid isomerase-like protein
MRKIKMLFCLSALAVAAGLLTLGAPAARADDKADIEALYAKISAAMKSKNLKAIYALGTSDFTTKANGVTMGTKESAKMMEDQFKTLKKVNNCSMKISKITIKGASAVVLSDSVFDATVSGPDGKIHKMADTGTSKDTLVKTKKGWLFKNVEMLTSKMTMDGKPYSPEAPGK